MDFIRNPFVKSIIFPIIFAVTGAILEAITALVKGKCNGNRKYRIWVREAESEASALAVPLLNQSIDTIRTHNNIVEIEQMVNFDISDFGGIGIKLIIGAYAIDIISLVGTQSDPNTISILLLVHLFFLMGIVYFIMNRHLASPEQLNLKRNRAAFSIGLGIFAMAITFFVL
jgi:hypothetical protein